MLPNPIVGDPFTPDGRRFRTIAVDGEKMTRPLPEPIVGDIDRLAREVGLATGRRVDEGRAVVPLARPE